ncbi:hypothetical protein [Mycobacterium decipiens]|uniref:Uncharacterized protein n=1 Tax=Mycobacterium decipiens TaxID=1430326 RepID=A0A1X2LXR4_9MYCO|nr:hypothetical protein [Mycobacterium decipiens]OSC41985.1 hypothetical protein B8W66_05450 [Mycobacterium decipiens]
MRGQGHQIFVDELARFAARSADQRVAAIAERAAEPLRVAVGGRGGVGRSTVARALQGTGSWSGIALPPPACAADPDVVVYVTVEVVKPEDCAAIAAARRPVVAVLNKADLAGPLSGRGPIATAQTRCGQFSKRVGVPMEPMIGLLAVAALDDLDDTLWAALRVLAAHSDGADCIDGSVAGFLGGHLPVPTEVRLRLLDTLDVFGIALGIAAFRQGRPTRTPAQVRALLRRVSGVDTVVARVTAAGAEARYRRLLEAVAELEVLAVCAQEISGQIGEFLCRDDTVLARMAAAIDMAAAAGRDVGPLDDPAAHLPRAVRWHRHGLANNLGGLGPGSDVHRACAADITRGSLRLWSRAGGAPMHGYPEAR